MNREDPRSRFSPTPPTTVGPVPVAPAESLVSDARAGVSPEQMIDRRLAILLLQEGDPRRPSV